MTARWGSSMLVAVLVVTGGCASAYRQGETALQQERYAEAASHFAQALREHPDRIDALVGLGIAQYEQGAYDDAAATLSRAVSRDPTHAQAQLYLGLVSLQRGDEGAAEEHLRAFHDLTKSARLARQVDDALQLLRTYQPLSADTRRFIADSLESAATAEQELAEAQAYPRWPYVYDPFIYDPFIWGP